MSLPTNPLAPHLSPTLSPAAVEALRQKRGSASLAPRASRHTDAIRRLAQDRDRDSELRPAFVRDIEKIMHVPAYNRLAGKTQVFSFRANDDLCRRGLHVQLVARVAKDIGAALGLNLPLIEAIALGHDIGHTPFGHAGERFLNRVYHARTGRYFFHNVQSVRVLDVLYGRNISLQTLDGVICHNGEFEQQRIRTSELASFLEFDAVVEDCWVRGGAAIAHLRPMTLEGCVVRLADIIAYVGKDRQDAIRAGVCNENSFDDGLGSAYNSWALACFVADVVENSLGKDRIELSEEAFRELVRAKRENYSKIYAATELDGEYSSGVAELFERLYEHELAMLAEGREEAAIFDHHIQPLGRHLANYGERYEWEASPDQCVCDFIAAMSDDYFMASCEALFDDAHKLFPRCGYFARGAKA